MKKNDIVSLAAFLLGLCALFFAVKLVVLGIIFAVAAIASGAVALVLWKGEKTVGRKFAIVGLVLGILAAISSLGRFYGKEGRAEPKPSANEQRGNNVEVKDIQKSVEDLQKAKSELKNAWKDVKKEFRRGLEGGVKDASSKSTQSTEKPAAENNRQPDSSAGQPTVRELLKASSESVVSESRRQQLSKIASAAKLFMTEKQKSGLHDIQTNASAIVDAIDKSMTEKDKADLKKLKEGIDAARKLYNEIQTEQD